MGVIGFIGLVGGIIGIYSDVFKTTSEASPGPASAEECISELGSPESSPKRIIDVWYCETQFAGIWTGEKPVLLPENKPLILRNFPAFDPFRNLDQEAPKLSDSDKIEDGLAIKRIFLDFSQYADRGWTVLGQVRLPQRLFSNNGTNSEWVFQLGTSELPGSLIYARVALPADWMYDRTTCAIGVVTGVPIARGMSQEPGDLQKFEVIYIVSSTFSCLPATS